MPSQNENIHLIISEDDYLVTEAARKIIGDYVDVDLIDSRTSTNEELQLSDIRRADESFSTPPFLEPVKVTWWKNVGFLPGAKGSDGEGGGGRGPSAAVKEALQRFADKVKASQLPPNQIFILSGSKLLKTSTFAKAFAAHAHEQRFEVPKKERDAQAFALARAVEAAKAEGLKFVQGADIAFVSLVGSDTRNLMNELLKLICYLGPDAKEITPQAVEAVTSRAIGSDVRPWDVTDGLGERNVAKLMRGFSRYQGDGNFAIFMTQIIEKFFRDYVAYKAALEEGRREVFDQMAPWMVNKIQGHLRNWHLTELRLARSAFLELRERMVSTLSPEAAETLIVTQAVKYCRPPRRR